jgi:1-acyl-sn-glycerol-3-phosphate acyltransferase
MGEVLPGAVLMALRSKVPIVPVGIWGTQHVVPYGQMLPRPTLAKVHVHFAAPHHLRRFSVSAQARTASGCNGTLENSHPHSSQSRAGRRFEYSLKLN